MWGTEVFVDMVKFLWFCIPWRRVECETPSKLNQKNSPKLNNVIIINLNFFYWDFWSEWNIQTNKPRNNKSPSNNKQTNKKKRNRKTKLRIPAAAVYPTHYSTVITSGDNHWCNSTSPITPGPWLIISAATRQCSIVLLWTSEYFWKLQGTVPRPWGRRSLPGPPVFSVLV